MQYNVDIINIMIISNNYCYFWFIKNTFFNIYCTLTIVNIYTFFSLKHACSLK